MFGLSRVFEDDPFFRDTFTAHNEHVRHLFSEPFGRDPFLSIEDRQGGLHHRGHPNSQMALRDNDKAMSCSLMPFNSFGGMGPSFPFIPFGTFGGMAMSFPLMPFGCFGGMNMNFRNPFFAMDRMMSNMRNGMVDLQRNFDKMAVDPNAHSYSSSSVMTYSKKGDEPPKVFQASAQTRTAPGGIKEIRKACRDSESGLEKMAVGHHIHDRAHVIQKAKNNKTGEEELNQEFINLDEGEAHTFDEQWQKEILKFKPSGGGKHNIESPKHRSIHHVSKEDVPRREKMHPRTAIEGPRRPVSSLEKLSVKGSHVPLKPSKK